MPPWLSFISAAQRKNAKHHSSRWLQLSTIGIDNTPRVRTVVFRGWSDAYEMKIFTDKRSQKYNELEFNNNVEICWLFSRSKCQFRFRGQARVDEGKDKFHHWRHLNDKSKDMWAWPNPGDLLLKDNHMDLTANEIIDSIDNFILLKIEISHVDQLLLHDPIHTRKRWIKKNIWIEERINP